MKMVFHSIKTRISATVILGLMVFIVLVVFLAKDQLQSIVNVSQEAMYKEKIGIILNSIDQANNQLEKTGLVEAYIDDFQKHLIDKLQNIYYLDNNSDIYPVIFSFDGKIIMHPYLYGNLSDGSVEDNIRKHEHVSRPSLKILIQELQAQKNNLSQGNLFSTSSKEGWYFCKLYDEWGWIVAYAIPIENKYAQVNLFIQKLITGSLLIFLFTGIIVFIAITGITTPIIKLTEIASKIAKGDLNQEISIHTSDEVGELAQSFSEMQQSIRSKVGELLFFRNHFYEIINSMPSSIIVIDTQRKISQWNKKAEESYNISVENAVGKQVEELLPRFHSLINSLFETMYAEHREVTERIYTNEDGKSTYEDITVYPIDEGAVIRIDDVTEHVEMEETLKHSQKMEAIGQLAGGVAHDFNNMLGGIIGAAQLLRSRNKAVDKKEERYIDLIEKAASRAADLTNKLLVFSRKKPAMKKSVNLEKIVDETIALLRRSIDKRIEIVSEYHASNAQIMGDESQIQSIIMNVCINASHAIPGNGTITIRTALRNFDDEYCKSSAFDISKGTYVSLEIEDDGSGIEEQNIPKIFDPFFTTKEQGKGTGLGLSAVYGSVETHHGEIFVKSRLHEGTKFTINFPVINARVSEEIVEEQHTTLPATVLLVDDEEIVRAVLYEILKQLGFTILVASNGQEALDLYRQNADRIHLVILDMVMPGLNGRDVLMRLRELNANVKVIISSGFSDIEDDDIKESGKPDGYIQKPYRVDELNKVMSDVLMS